MNVSLQTGQSKNLRDMMVLSDKYRDPQGYILAYDNAYKIGEAIVKDSDDIYLRAKNAAVECVNLLENADSKLQMTRFEKNALADASKALAGLTDDSDKFLSDSLEQYKQEVKVFRPENYGL
jgi:methanol--5-hydroxybenzimidazolylcobamide Co-methyltransferase